MKEDDAEQIRAALMLRLREQAGRLVRFVDLKAPAPVTANEVGLILKTALVLFPDHVWTLIGETLVRQARMSKWICQECGKRWIDPNKWPVCEACRAQIDRAGGDDG